MSHFEVLSFHIKSYKTERNGKKVEVLGPDDVLSHSEANSVSQTIQEILMSHDLVAADIISLTGDYTNARDIGSWDFWMFCRNPNGALTKLKA